MRPRIISVSATLALLPSLAFAHPGHDETATFAQGLVHPLSGADHLLAMVMVGLFAVQMGGRALWLLPATFLAAMAAGSLAGLSGITTAATEIGIALSVAGLGAIVALQLRTPLAVATALVAAVALVHGHAHRRRSGTAPCRWPMSAASSSGPPLFSRPGCSPAWSSLPSITATCSHARPASRSPEPVSCC